MQLLALLGIVLAGLALFGIAWWIERLTRRAGLAFASTAVLLLGAAGLGLADGQWLRALLSGVHAIAFLYFAHWRRTTARAASAGAVEE